MFELTEIVGKRQETVKKDAGLLLPGAVARSRFARPTHKGNATRLAMGMLPASCLCLAVSPGRSRTEISRPEFLILAVVGNLEKYFLKAQKVQGPADNY